MPLNRSDKVNNRKSAYMPICSAWFLGSYLFPFTLVVSHYIAI